MTGQKGEAKPFAPGPAADDMTAHETLAGQATQLGLQHRAAGTTPFGDAHYVYWDQGSARLLSKLGVTSPTTSVNAGWRQHLVSAYCDALEASETGDVEPGS
jgi:hypothetical protein